MIFRLALILLLPAWAWAQYYGALEPAGPRAQKVFKYAPTPGGAPFFAVGYSDESRTALWSAFTLAPASAPVTTCKRAAIFNPEPGQDPVITQADYAGTGYDRGHMVPNAVMAYWQGCGASKATFITSNLCPQAHPFNAGVWSRLEADIAGMARSSGFRQGLVRKGRTVWVYCGPVLAPEDPAIGPKRIEVPSGFWKTVIWKDEGGSLRTLSFLFKHDGALRPDSAMAHATTLRAVQAATGLKLVAEGSALLDQQDAEAFQADALP